MFAPQLQPLQWQIDFYERHYEIIDQRFVHPGLRITLGNKHAASCRFCRRAAPQVSFRKLAHAIPELLGNKSLFTVLVKNSYKPFLPLFYSLLLAL